MEPKMDELASKPWVVFDCETTGLFDFKKPADAPGQPRLAALAMIRATPTLAVTEAKMFYVRPDGWRMESGASAVNGLTDEFLHENGVGVSEVLDYYEAAIKGGYAFAAFNAQFDTKVMRAEFRRAGRPDNFDDTPNLCIMRKSVGVCKIPKKDGRGYKFPKLDEACAHFKIERRAGSHNAQADCGDALRVFRMLMQIGIDCTPEIHRAKPKPEAASGQD
jgi:DNA polymerase III epsilon subunit-like protein